MDKLEKVERLRERANVSYEEARAALEAADGDLLDAMVLLEKQGKTGSPKQESYSTKYEEQTSYIPVELKVREQEASAPTFKNSLGKLVKAVARFVTGTSLHITRKGNDLITLPTWIAALLIFFSWRISVPLALIAMLFGVRYSFEGKVNTDAANDLLNKAGSFADGLESELHRKE